MPNEINTSDGFIKLHRKILNWEWYDNANTMRVFLHCLLSANHKDNNWHGISVKQGSFITSIGKLAQRLKLSEKQIRTAISKLKMTGEVASKGTSKYTIITVKNWDTYQEKGEQKDKQRANKGRTKGEQRAINKNDKNDKNENNEKNILLDNNKKSPQFIPPTIAEIQDYCLERNNGINAEYFYNYYEAKGWLIGKGKMKSWKASVRLWEIREKQDKAKRSDYNNLINEIVD